MEKRAVILALALTLPLALYGIPYAYAATSSSSYVVKADSFPLTNAHVHCNAGDYATGGGGRTRAGSTLTTYTEPETWNGVSYVPTVSGTPNAWGAEANDILTVFVVCQTPITVAGIGVPEFGSLYVAIALGVIVYFFLSRQFARRPTISAGAKA
jgi:hypothetical protein